MSFFGIFFTPTAPLFADLLQCAQSCSAHFDGSYDLRLTHSVGFNTKNDELTIFRRATGVKRPEMTPEIKFSCLKPDFYQILGLTAFSKEGKAI